MEENYSPFPIPLGVFGCRLWEVAQSPTSGSPRMLEGGTPGPCLSHSLHGEPGPLMDTLHSPHGRGSAAPAGLCPPPDPPPRRPRRQPKWPPITPRRPHPAANFRKSCTGVDYRGTILENEVCKLSIFWNSKTGSKTAVEKHAFEVLRVSSPPLLSSPPPSLRAVPFDVGTLAKPTSLKSETGKVKSKVLI